MKVLNVNSILSLKSGGGTAERTFQMSKYLLAHGVETRILTLDIELDKNRLAHLPSNSVITLPVLSKRFFIPFFQVNKLISEVKECEIVHLMGHWSLLNAAVYCCLVFYHKPYVVSPAGALPIYGRSKVFKNLYNLIFGKRIIKNASGWIAITASECSHFEPYGISADRVTIIPNGVSVDLDENSTELAVNSLPPQPYVLFMGRLNLIKGPDLLLGAYLIIKKQFPNYHLVFAGPDGGMLNQLRQTVKDHQIANKVHFFGHVDGSLKQELFRRASILVVSSRHEAMSIVAIEAGVLGTLVLVTDQCGFSQIGSVDARLEVPASSDAIARGLLAILADKNLDALKTNWMMYVKANFDWNVLVNKFINLYEKILAKA